MVKVIENNNIFQCNCEHCRSILEYSSNDIRLVPIGQRQEAEMICCPACGRNTRMINRARVRIADNR